MVLHSCREKHRNEERKLVGLLLKISCSSRHAATTIYSFQCHRLSLLTTDKYPFNHTCACCNLLKTVERKKLHELGAGLYFTAAHLKIKHNIPEKAGFVKYKIGFWVRNGSVVTIFFLSFAKHTRKRQFLIILCCAWMFFYETTLHSRLVCLFCHVRV